MREREGGDYVQLLRFAVKQCEGVAMLPCCTVLREVEEWEGRGVRPLHSQGACNEFVAVCRRLAAAWRGANNGGH